jgi:hypothetical protein
MYILLGDRFLKRFTGEILHKLKHPTSITEEQKPDADDDKVVNPNNNAAKEIHEKDTADSRETGQTLKENTSEGDNG